MYSSSSSSSSSSSCSSSPFNSRLCDIRAWDDECLIAFKKPMPVLWNFLMRNLGYLKICERHKPTMGLCDCGAHPLNDFLMCAGALLCYYGRQCAPTLLRFIFSLRHTERLNQLVLLDVLNENADILTIKNYQSMHGCFRSYIQSKESVYDLLKKVFTGLDVSYWPSSLYFPEISRVAPQTSASSLKYRILIQAPYNVCIHTSIFCECIYSTQKRQGESKINPAAPYDISCNKCFHSSDSVPKVLQISTNHPKESYFISFEKITIEICGLLNYSLHLYKHAAKEAFLLGCLRNS